MATQNTDNTIIATRKDEANLRQSTSLTPKLRFKEFDDEWNKSAIEDHFEFKNGLNKEKEFFGYGTPIINFKDVYNLEGIKINDIKGLVKLSDVEIKRYDALKGDVFFTRTSETVFDIGMAAALVEDIPNCVFSGFVLRARPIDKALVDDYKKFCFGTWSVRKEIVTKSSFTTRALTSGTLLNKVAFYFPKTHQEQQRIASFLSAVNQKIQQLTKKKALLEQYKKGVMQQLFSGQLRFKDENGNAYPDWEWVGGNELFNNISDKNHNSDLPILAITQDQGAIPRELINYKMTVTDASVASYKIVQIGDFVISLRTFQGGIEFSDYHGICSPAYIILRASSDEVDRTFYKFYLKTSNYIKQLQKNLEGIRDGKMISYKYFSEIKIPFPSYPEQQKIAAYLSSIDTKTECVINQLTQTQTFKKGLLQQLFVAA